MDNQHRHIKGYRDLSQAEIDLMNEAKELQARIMQFHAKVAIQLGMQQSKVASAATTNGDTACSEEASIELERFIIAEPLRWLAIAKTDIQTGFMALIRSIAQPSI